MALYIVATPIGNLEDITTRARNCLAGCDVVIGEEHRVASTLLKKLGLPQREIYLLNEHSKEKDLKELVDLCREKNVALISDAGTPAFADPGADLVRMCRAQSIHLTSLPGASSLMTALSLTGRRIDQFTFLGFLPAEKEERVRAIQNLKSYKHPVVILETPYRLGAALNQLADAFPGRRAFLGLNLTQEDELHVEGTLKELSLKYGSVKAEPVLVIYP